MNTRRLVLTSATLALLVVIGVGSYRLFFAAPDAPRYKLVKIESGPLTAMVAATGTLNPVVSVPVGSQVSGQIKEIFADFNSEVKASQLIARIDPENFAHKVRQAEADLEAARATALIQRADVNRVEAGLREAMRDYARKKSLVERKFISAAELDKAEAALDAAKALLEVARAQILSSAAVVRQREAQLAQTRVDLGRTEIRSPVDGVVVKRSVDRGQTVAASLQAPELFIIAQNLTDMQVETSIDEADVGRIKLGQKASFTVDAFPGRSFAGTVKQVRKAAKVESNVVTYTVVVSANNADLSLLPGMTANVRIVSAQKEKVLKVSNAALRFRPIGTGDDKSATATSATQSDSPRGGAGGTKQIREKLVKELGLDANQQAKLDNIYTAMRDKFAAARELPEGENAKATERNRAEIREQTLAILNPEQRPRYEEIIANLQAARASGQGANGRVWLVGDDGNPKSIALKLGLNDGTMTEIIGGDITEGAAVIVGNANTTNKAATPGLRMF